MEQGLTIGDTVHIVLKQAAAGCGPDLGALVPNPTTVEAIEAVRREEVVELGTPRPKQSPSSTGMTEHRVADAGACGRSSARRSSGATSGA